MSKTFCPLPWNHLATHPQGSVTLCCESDMHNRISESFMRDDPESTRADKRGFLTFKRTNYDFFRIANGQSFNEVRTDFLNNRVPKACEKCFMYEDIGISSKRQRELERLNLTLDDAKKITNDDGSLKKLDYEFIELRLGNHCNLACRSCNPASSTRWLDDWTKLNDRPWDIDKDLFDWPLDTDFWKKLSLSTTDKLRQIYINGGEPLLIDKHANYLEYLVKNDYAKDINLYYSTNCTVKNKVYLDYWPHFKEVEFLVSIDDIGERNQYIRYPSDWSKVLDTYKWFQSLRDEFDNIKISIMQTLSMYNIYYVDKFFDFWHEFDEYAYIHYNFVYAPDYLSAANMVDSIKKEIFDKLEHMPRSQEILNFLRNDRDENTFKVFLQKTAKLDKMRNEDFSSVFPELDFLFKEQGY